MATTQKKLDDKIKDVERTAKEAQQAAFDNRRTIAKIESILETSMREVKDSIVAIGLDMTRLKQGIFGSDDFEDGGIVKQVREMSKLFNEIKIRQTIRDVEEIKKKCDEIQAKEIVSRVDRLDVIHDEIQARDLIVKFDQIWDSYRVAVVLFTILGISSLPNLIAFIGIIVKFIEKL